MDELLRLEKIFKSRRFLKPEEMNYLYSKYVEAFPNKKLSKCPACILEAFKLLINK